MKFVLMCLLVCLLDSVDGTLDGERATNTRFSKIECSSSNKTCEKPFCYLKSYSRYKTTINFGCVFNKDLNKVYVIIK